MKGLIHWLSLSLILLVLSASGWADSTVELRHLRTLKVPCQVTTQPAWHPNGRELAVGCNLHRTVTIWDVQTGKVLRTLDKEKGSVWVLTYSPDGKYLAVGRSFVGKDTLNLYDTADGNLLRSFSPPPAEGSGYKWGSANALAFSPDSSRLVTGGSGTPVSIFDVETGKLVSTFFDWGMRPNEEKKGINSVTSVAYSPDGRWIAVGYVDGRFEIWRADSWSLVKQLTAPTIIRGIAFSPNGEYIAIGSGITKKPNGSVLPYGSDIYILENPSFAVMKHFLAYGKTAVASLLYMPDSKLLVSGGAPAKVIDAEKGTILRVIKFTSTVHFPTASKNGKRLAVASGQEVRLYELIP